MTVKELIEHLQSIDKKYQDAEVEICNQGTADTYRIQSVDDQPSFDQDDWDECEYIFINI